MAIYQVAVPSGKLYIQASSAVEANQIAKTTSGYTSGIYIQKIVNSIPTGYTLTTSLTTPFPSEPTNFPSMAEPTLGSRKMTSQGEMIMTPSGWQTLTSSLDRLYPPPVATGTKIMTPEGEKIMTSEGYKTLTSELEQKYPSLVPIGTKIMTSEGEKVMTFEGYKPITSEPTWVSPPKPIPAGSEPTGVTIRVTIPMTQGELDQIAQAKAEGLCVGAMQSYYTVKTYKATLRDGGRIYVEALDEDSAKKKAIEGGYKVAWVTWSPSYEEGEVKPKAEVPSVKLQSITVGVYKVTDPAGGSVELYANSEADAKTLAIRQGFRSDIPLTVEKVKDKTITLDEAYEILEEAQRKSDLDYAWALKVLGGVFGPDYQMPTDYVPVVTGTHEGGLDFMYVPPPLIEVVTASGLSWKDYFALPRTELAGGDSIPTVSLKDKNGNILMLGWEDIPSQYQDIGQSQGYEAMVGTMMSDYENAGQRLQQAGFVTEEDFTIPELAKFTRENPDGVKTLQSCGFSDDVIDLVEQFNDEASRVVGNIDAGLKNNTLGVGEKQALSRAFDSANYGMSVSALHDAGVFTDEQYEMMKNRFGEAQLNASASTFEAGLVSEFLASVWKNIDPDMKITIAFAYDQDYTKGNSFSSVVKGLEYEMQKGPWQMLVTAIPATILGPFAKEAVIEEGRKVLNKEYDTALTTLKPYVESKVDVLTTMATDASQLAIGLGTKVGETPKFTSPRTFNQFDVDTISKKFDSDPTWGNKVLGETGYESKEELLGALDYYNHAVQVSSKEWAIAGIVGALSVLPLVGGATAGATTRIVTSALGNALPVTLGALTLPDTIKAVKDPDAPTWMKGMAVGATALMFSPLLGPAIRSIQFMRVATRNDYVPMRSLAIERFTTRVGPFTDKQIARMVEAGLTTSDILGWGTKITKQLMAGAKAAYVEGPGFRIKVSNVQYQRMVGNAVFHSTPDGTLIVRGFESTPVIKELYTAGKVAIDPLERAYVTGMRGNKPAIIEIRGESEVFAQLFPQKKLLAGGKIIEPEFVIPALDQLAGLGYRLELIPGSAGRGVTFDATLGKVDIYRFTVAKVVDNPTGLIRVRLGETGDGGVVAFGDFHGTSNYLNIFEALNDAFSEPLIAGDPNNPATWTWIASKNKGRSVVFMGDLIDRGPAYQVLRETFNRLSDQAIRVGDDVVRLLGNHELAYISGDVIKGGIKGFPEIIPDNIRAQIKADILSDIQKGYVKSAYSKEGKLFTHAGISKGVYENLVGKPPEYIAQYLQNQLSKNVKSGDFSSNIYAKGRVERASSLSTNERAQGGHLWLRPQETKAGQLDWGFTQVVGHNPGWEVRGIWGPNFIETDVGTLVSGKVGKFVDTPYMTVRQARILIEKLPGSPPEITGKIQVKLTMSAMRDTIADFFLGWDGRTQAIMRIKENAQFVKAYIKEIDLEIAIRRAAGDTEGIKLLQRMKVEITSPEGRDYLYGGIGFWRDIVMGRQNSAKVMDTIPSMAVVKLQAVVGNIGSIGSKLARFSNTDIQRMFGMSKNELVRLLDVSKIRKTNIETYRTDVLERVRSLVDIVDRGLERSVLPYLDQNKLAANYAERLKDYAREWQNREYDISYIPREFDERAYREREQRIDREVERVASRELRERVEEYYRQQGGARQPYEPRSVYAPRDVRAPRGGRVPPYVPYAPYPPYPPYPPKPPYPSYPPIEKRHRRVAIKGVTRKGPLVPEGSIAWAQGKLKRKGKLGPQWYYIPPPWTQETPISLGYAPLGAKNAEETTPKKTIQMIGKPGAKVPESVSIDLGVVDIYIRDYGRTIEFKGHGEETKVGKSLNIPTRGMSIPATAPMRVAKLKKRGNMHKKVASSRTVIVG